MLVCGVQQCSSVRHISVCVCVCVCVSFLAAQSANNIPAMQETWVRFLGWEDPLEKVRATHLSILAWRIPWAEEPDGLQFMRSQRVGHNLVAKPALQIYIYIYIYIHTYVYMYIYVCICMYV